MKSGLGYSPSNIELETVRCTQRCPFPVDTNALLEPYPTDKHHLTTKRQYIEDQYNSLRVDQLASDNFSSRLEPLPHPCGHCSLNVSMSHLHSYTDR